MNGSRCEGAKCTMCDKEAEQIYQGKPVCADCFIFKSDLAEEGMGGSMDV